MKQEYCDRCNCVQWKNEYYDETRNGNLVTVWKILACPDCGRETRTVLRQYRADRLEQERGR